MEALDQLLNARGAVHGSFQENARISQALKQICHSAPGWSGMGDREREAIDMIAMKISRILSGQSSNPEHWEDVQGYAALACHEDPNR
jgi:hypothetical protein